MPLRLLNSSNVRAPWLWPAAIAVAALVAVLAALDPTGDHPGGFDGPGLTIDEPFNVEQGVLLADQLLDVDWTGYREADAGLHDHPPLGRIWIGLCHELAYLVWPPTGTSAGYSVTCARTAPAIAFALTVFLAGWCAGRWYGPLSGAVAALSLVLMPRLFGHAHLASLETPMNLAYLAVVFYVADRWGAETPVPSAPAQSAAPSAGVVIVGGILFGLALLTKVQAILLPVPIAVWSLCLWRTRAIWRIAAFGIVGLGVMFLVWPHLQSAPVGHLLEYLGRTTNRASIHVWYLGSDYADRDVPWHYPWVLFITTVPIGLQILGICGVASRVASCHRTARDTLLGMCLVFPLIVFSLPGVPVYDGERLFSIVFPLWAIVIGAGAQAVNGWLAGRIGLRPATRLTAAFIACQGTGLFLMGPCWLSYYNLAVGGLPGAVRLGLQSTYWGDGLTRSLLAETATRAGPRGRVQVAPVLHDFYWPTILKQSPALLQQEMEFVTADANRSDGWLLLIPRQEYLSPDLRSDLSSDHIEAAVRRAGVPLAVLCRQR